MINLGKDDFLQSGSERDCYVHPLENNKVIKIVQEIKKNGSQNDIEYKYYKYLKKYKASLEHIPQCYGVIDTNLGKGLVFDKIVNFDNTESQQFKHYIKNKLLTESQEEKLLDQLKRYLETNKILFVDASLRNVLCQKIAEDEYKLMIIDGLGGRRTGLKATLYLQRLLLPYHKYKIKKQWKMLLFQIYRVKKGIKK